jgi:hypothetical protein
VNYAPKGARMDVITGAIADGAGALEGWRRGIFCELGAGTPIGRGAPAAGGAPPIRLVDGQRQTANLEPLVEARNLAHDGGRGACLSSAVR